MKKYLLGIALLISASIGFSRSAEPVLPAIEVRVKSITDLLSYAKIAGEIADKPDEIENFVGVIKAFGGGKKGLEGLDMKRPFGFYSMVTKDVADSPAILLVPVADEEKLLNAMKTYLKLDVKKEGEVYQTTLPKVPLPVFFNFQNNYLVVTLGSSKNLTGIIPSSKFFSESKSVASVNVHLDRIPEEIRKSIYAQIEFQIQKEKDTIEKNMPKSSERAIKIFAFNSLAAITKSIWDEAKTISMDLVIDQEKETVTLDTKIIPKSDTALGKTFAQAAIKESTTMGRIPNDKVVVSTGINFSINEEWKKKLSVIVDEILNAAESQADPFIANQVKQLIGAIEPTLKAGELDSTFTINETSNKPTLHSLTKVVKGIDVRDAIMEFFKIIPNGIIEPKFETAKVNGVKIDSFTIHENPGKLETIFGSKTIWMGFSDHIWALGIESDGEIMKKILESKPQKNAIVEVDISVGKLAVLVAEDDKKEKMQKTMAKKLTSKVDQHDFLSLRVNGGNELAIKLTAKKDAIKGFVLIDKVNKDNE